MEVPRVRARIPPRVRPRPGAGRDDGGRRGPRGGPADHRTRAPSSSSATPTGGCATWPGRPTSDVEVEPVAADTDDGRSVIRHSAAHVLAQAVQQLRPEAKLGIGPPITDGFYYDFDVEQPVHPGRPAASSSRP